MRAARKVSLALLAGTLAGCATSSDDEQPARWPETAGCRCSVTADRPSYRFDQWIEVPSNTLRIVVHEEDVATEVE